MSPIPGQLTFAINRRLLAGGLVVDDKDVLAAMAYAFRELKLVMEPSGGPGGSVSGKFDCKGRNIGLVCSGGNLDPATFLGCLSAQADRASSQRR